MGNHTHGSGNSRDDADVSDAQLLWSVVLNQLLTVGQVGAGVFSGSIALLSDATTMSRGSLNVPAVIAEQFARAKRWFE